jgi:formylglycine-generating enzyme required for sulfatase activity
MIEKLACRAAEDSMARVFVSYSRKNIDFARKLIGRLQEREMDFWVDWEGIPPTVDWMKEIEKGIEEADTFLAIVSPEWISSKVCKNELDIAVRNGKRLIPVVPYDVDGNDVPPALAHLNFVFFTPSHDFNQQLHELFTALDTDYDWLRTHRRLQVKALEWERANKDSGFLLRGKDLEEAERQISVNATKNPNPTDLQREYVLTSRQTTDRQNRITTGSLSAAVLVMLGIIVALAYPYVAEWNAKRLARGEMVMTPAGDTIFGTDNPEYIELGFVPRQVLHLPAFQIGKYEVTNYQYGLCVEYGNCTVPADQTEFRDEFKRNHPVVNVTLFQAGSYCHWLGQRLPTTVEWERAARGPNGNSWPWGNDALTSELATLESGTQPVNSNPNGASKPEGIYNLIGNVWEWTSSYEHKKGDEYDMTQFWDGKPETYKGTDLFVLRGGGWQYYYQDDVALTFTFTGVTANPELGIRCAADVK